jgi:hypothetical protein
MSDSSMLEFSAMLGAHEKLIRGLMLTDILRIPGGRWPYPPSLRVPPQQNLIATAPVRSQTVGSPTWRCRNLPLFHDQGAPLPFPSVAF